jgi:hypothetical protein
VQHVTQQPTLATECTIFTHTMNNLDELASNFIEDECRKRYCNNAMEWFDIVRDLSDEDCAICTEQYQPPDPLWKDGNGITKRTGHTPIELRYKYITCLPCFINCVCSGMDNSKKCPLCRADLPPPNLAARCGAGKKISMRSSIALLLIRRWHHKSTRKVCFS